MTRALLVDGSSRDYLSNHELAGVLAQCAAVLGRKIDVLVLDACLMSSWELLFEISTEVSSVVASMDELSAAGIELANPATYLTMYGGSLDASEMAGSFARFFMPVTGFDTCIAIDLTRGEWAAASAAFRAFAAELVHWVHQSPVNSGILRSALRDAATRFIRYSGGGLADMNAFGRSIASIPNLPVTSIELLQTAVRMLNSCVVGRAAGADYSGALGVSIFSPDSAATFASNRGEYSRLSFPRATGWQDVLSDVFDASIGEGAWQSTDNAHRRAQQQG